MRTRADARAHTGPAIGNRRSSDGNPRSAECDSRSAYRDAGPANGSRDAPAANGNAAATCHEHAGDRYVRRVHLLRAELIGGARLE